MTNNPQEEFVESLKERLALAGEKNVVIKDASESSRKKAMENIAEAFSEPVNDFIDKKSASGGGSSNDVVSYDGSVAIGHGTNPVTGEPITNLSVAGYVESVVGAHNVNAESHPDIREEIARGDKENADAIAAETAAREAAVLRIAPPESAGTGEVIFYRGELV